MVVLALLVLTLFVSAIAVVAHTLSEISRRRRSGLRPLFTWGDGARLNLVSVLTCYVYGLFHLNWASDYDYCRLLRTGDTTGVAAGPGAELESYERAFLPLHSRCDWSDGVVEQTVPWQLNLLLVVLLLSWLTLTSLAVQNRTRTPRTRTPSAKTD
jgi:hypothetical protein